MFPEKLVKRFKKAHLRPRSYANGNSDLVMVQVDALDELNQPYKLTQFVHQDVTPSPVVDSHVFDKSRVLETGLDKQLTTKFTPVMTLDGVDLAMDSYGNFKTKVDEELFIKSLTSKPDPKPDSKPDVEP